MKKMVNGVMENLTGKAAEVVKDQPGYSADKDGVYMLAKAKTGGIRLYKRIEGKWMDASLDDIQDDSITSLFATAKTKFYRQSVGECVSQVYEVEADDWNEAKRAAFDDMKEGDILAECPPEAVKQDERYPEFYEIDEDMCENYATLCKGAWEGNDWLEDAWYFDDDPETLFNPSGELI